MWRFGRIRTCVLASQAVKAQCARLRIEEEMVQLQSAFQEACRSAEATRAELDSVSSEKRELEERHQVVAMKVRELLALEQSCGASNREVALRDRIQELKEQVVVAQSAARSAIARCEAEAEAASRHAQMAAQSHENIVEALHEDLAHAVELARHEQDHARTAAAETEAFREALEMADGQMRSLAERTSLLITNLRSSEDECMHLREKLELCRAQEVWALDHKKALQVRV